MTRRHLLILALLLPLLVSACGRKGPPRPLLQKLPAAAQNLVLQQQGQRLLVAWSLPEANQDDSPLTDLQGFQVFKMTYDPDRECPECRDTSVLRASIDLDYLRDVTREGNRLYLWDTGLEAGNGYQYRVVPVNAKGRAGEPAVGRRPFFPPPPAPATLSASGHDRLARLAWETPAGIRQGATLLGFNVYRRQMGESFGLQPVNGTPLATPEFEDFGLENGVSYVYAVRTVVAVDKWQVESALSPPAQATPQAGQ